MAIPIGSMTHIVILVVILCQSLAMAVMKIDCNAIRNEVEIFRQVSPSGLSMYKDDFVKCKINQINGLTINDYFNS